ncbi:MAG: Insulinase (Peptidase M16) [Candelina submexicana]|nr:MAG: Insulinase (Peptidase M16) [Candelina submexicana]
MPGPTLPPPELLANRLEAPALDDRSYRVIRLANKLEALLVHDADTDKASAAMDVNVGSFGDPEDMPGMAHAVEHLLFMGTEKYPVENAYSAYLSANSGHSNAFTAPTSTNYFFEVAASSTQDTAEKQVSPFYGALDRFAQFFIAPLFLDSSLDRELNAVDSENKKNLQDDGWRLHQLDKSLSNPKHPYCHFSTGNLETLRDEPRKRGVQIREEFMKFHDKEYSANRMKLVVLGRESLDELQSWVQTLFSDVRNKDLPQKRWDGISTLTEKELLNVIHAKPVMETRKLNICWPYQDEIDLYESQPGHYLSHLVGHEGPGSILAYIKAKGWANGLSGGAYDVCPGSGLFSIDVRLTEDGLANYEEIIKVIFQYISMVREAGPQQWIFEEMKGLAEVDFRFREKSPASRFTSHLGSTMQRPYPRERLLSASSVITKYDPEGINKALSYLRPDNFRLNVITQGSPPGFLDRKERWYGTEYRCDPLKKEFLADVTKAAQTTRENRIADLHLPHKNEFIPTRLEVEKKEVEEPMKAPKLIRNDEGVRVWWKKDDTFWVPKANVTITLRNPLVYATPEHAVMTGLYVKLVKDALNEYAYDADLAGLAYGFQNHSIGLDVELSGFNDKMSVLLEKVLLKMRDLEVKPDRFKVIHEKMLRAYRNWDFNQPYHQVGEHTRFLNSEKRWTTEQSLTELHHITPEDIARFYPLLLKQVHIEALVHGNLYKEDALKLADLVENTLKPRPLPEAQWSIQRSLIFPEGSDYIYPRTLKDPANVNHCIEYLLSVGDGMDRALRAKLLLFSQMTEEPAFDQLRTKEQLGYIVFTGARMSATTMGYRVIVQSERNAPYLEKRINAFLAGFKKTLDEMSQEDVNEHKRSAVNKRKEKLKNLDEESDRLWGHILSEYFDFGQVEHDVSHISALSKSDLQDFYNYFISPSSPARSKVSVHMAAQSSPGSIAKTSTPEEKKDQVLALLNQYLTSQGIVVEPANLAERFENVDVAGGDQDAILAATKTYITSTPAGGDEKKVNEIIEQGKALLGMALPGLGIEVKSKVDGEVDGVDGVEGEVNVEESEVIENVHLWKAGLGISKGARPVVELSSFEELGAKL